MFFVGYQYRYYVSYLNNFNFFHFSVLNSQMNLYFFFFKAIISELIDIHIKNDIYMRIFIALVPLNSLINPFFFMINECILVLQTFKEKRNELKLVILLLFDKFFLNDIFFHKRKLFIENIRKEAFSESKIS